MSEFTEKLKAFMQENHLSRREVGQLLGVSHASISMWLNEQTKPSNKRMKDIEEMFKIGEERKTMGTFQNNDWKKNGSGYYDPTAVKAIKNVENGGVGMKICRGDIFYINKSGNVTGSAMEAGRPAVIVSNDTNNKFSETVEVVFLTGHAKNTQPTHVNLVCRVPSTVLCEQINTVAKERIGDFVRCCTVEEMAAIEKAMLVSLGIEAYAGAEHENEIAELRMMLEDSEKNLKKKQEHLLKMQDEIEILKKTPDPCVQTEMTRMTTERDLYKSLYEQMLEKLIER